MFESERTCGGVQPRGQEVKVAVEMTPDLGEIWGTTFDLAVYVLPLGASGSIVVRCV